MLLLNDIDHVLDVMQPDHKSILDDEITHLVEQRQIARKAKNFAEADRIRDYLADLGVIIEDTREGIRWRRK